MSEWFNAGRISPVPSGTWNDTTEYKRLDIVTDPNMQRSYIAKKDVPAGTPLTDTEYWQLLVDAFHAVSLKTAADRLASPFSETSKAVACHPVEDYPLDVVTHIEPVQEGSGDPSPDNIRPITGHTGDVLTRCGKNLIPDDKLTLQDKNIRAYFGDPEGFLLYAGVTYTLSLGSTPANAVYVTTMDKAGGDGDIAKAYSKTSLTFTPSKDVRAQFNAYWTNGRPTDAYMMLEPGSTATTYAIYNGETFTTDFGQTVYGGELNWNTGVLTVVWGMIASYAGETLIGEWMSDRDVYTKGATPTTGAQVCYKLATPITIQLTPQEIPALGGVNTLYAEAGDVTVSGRISPVWMNEQLKSAIIALGGNV